MDLRPYALVLHIFGFAMWVGNMFGVAATLEARDKETDTAAKATLARLARGNCKPMDVGFGIALVGGLWLISIAPAYYSNQPWLVAKLLTVFGLIGIHALLRIKSKRAAVDGEGTFPVPLLGVMSLFSLAIIVFVIFKPWARA